MTGVWFPRLVLWNFQSYPNCWSIGCSGDSLGMWVTSETVEWQFCKTEPLICEIWCYLQVFTVRIKLNPRIPNWCPRIAWWCGSLLLTLKLGLRTPKSCVRLCDSVDCRLPGSSVHGILQARILEWIATPFFRESSWPRAQTRVSCTAGRFFNIWATRGAQEMARESIITDNLEKVGNNQKFSNLVWQII